MQSSFRKGLLVAAEDPGQLNGNGKLWGQLLDAAGKPIGAPLELDSGFRSLHFPDVITLPTSTAARLRFSLIYVDGGQSEEPGALSKLISLKITIPQ